MNDCTVRPTRKLVRKSFIGQVGSAIHSVPTITTRLSWSDVIGGWKARWTMGRMNYTVKPGLYAVGQPGRQSPVLVTANYKLTFDSLRCELGGIDAWILALDTKGINVWCAAGKGTFGTQELIRRLRSVKLESKIDHKSIILPQLGAPGIAAHEVTAATGFRVVYGPVRAADLPVFLSTGQVATPAMRQVRFNTWDRLVLTPAEFVFTFKPTAIIFGIMFILNVFGLGHYGLIDLAALAGTIIAGCIVTPMLLPIIPGRAFSFKGALIGLLYALGLSILSGWPSAPTDLLPWSKALAYLLAIPAITSYLAMNFTGSSTYASPSGVNREMRIALPLIIIALSVGILLLLLNDVLLLVI